MVLSWRKLKFSNEELIHKTQKRIEKKLDVVIKKIIFIKHNNLALAEIRDESVHDAVQELDHEQGLHLFGLKIIIIN